MTWLLVVIVIVVAVITADQISKLLVLKFMYEGQISLIPGVLRFTYVENRGMAFGLLEDHRWVFLVFATLGIGLVGFYLYRFARTALARVSLALVVGGGVGNMIDRLSLGFVVDFIDFCAFPFWTWVFNVADAAVCVGAALFVLDLILEMVRETKAAKARAAAAAEDDETEISAATGGENAENAPAKTPADGEKNDADRA